LFAATPPLEAKKMLMSMAVTGIGHQGTHRRDGDKLEFIDVRRAYSHARARRLVYIKLPEEDNQEGMCGTALETPLRIGKWNTWSSWSQ